jgi:cytochrome c-type biogenesis protein CcmH
VIGGTPARRLLGALLALALLLAAEAPAATSPDEILPDPVLEARARALGKELRCLVCQNQSIDDSDAPLAKDLRRLVRERLQAGDSDARIRQDLVARYGDFVLLEPPFKPATWALWIGPAVVLLVGAALVLAFLRRRVAPVPEPELSAEERTALAALLPGEGRDRPA